MEKDTYTAKEVAQIMGRSEQTVWRWLREGRIPGAEKLGQQYVIWKRPFDAWRNGERKSAA